MQYSDDEDDVKRVVRSAKDKRYEALNEIIKNIRNSKKINDFNKMETQFMDLQKAFDKARPVVAKEENGVTPRLVMIFMQITIKGMLCIFYCFTDFSSGFWSRWKILSTRSGPMRHTGNLCQRPMESLWAHSGNFLHCFSNATTVKLNLR